MDQLSTFGRTLVVAPHHDDDILGCGGTMARLARSGTEVFALIATTGQSPRFPAEFINQVVSEAEESYRIIGVKEHFRLHLPAAELDRLPAYEINARFGEVIEKVAPETLLVPFVGDIHLDHQLSFLASMVAARPRSRNVPKRILAYETLSETNWYAAGITPAFIPNIYVDITETLSLKLQAFSAFESQVKAFPDERSLVAIEAMARMRGATVYREAAEAFMMVREIV